ncbi:MAG: outer membrane beta-barrel protein [Burkholderiales bacterium]
MPRKQLQEGPPCMLRSWCKAAASALVALPICAAAFEAVDVLPSASSGLYPAYPSDPVPPYTFWAQAGVMYDSNILRQPSGNNHEIVTRLGIGGRVDQRVIGRQGLHLEGRVDGYLYDKFNELDNLAYAALGEWRYEVGNDLSGALGVSRRRFQASLAEIQRAFYDPIDETSLNGTTRYAIGPHLAVRGAAHWIDYKRPQRPLSNTRTVIVGGGVDYVSPLGNTVGVEVQEARGDAPVDQQVDPLGLFVNNDFRQRDIGVLGTFGVTPSIRVAGRVGRTTRSYTVLPGRDFSGPTWAVAAQWFPTAKTVFVVESAKNISSIIDVGASHMVVKGYSLGPGWAVTSKLNLQARYIRQHQTFEGDPAAALGISPIREEIVSDIRLGAYWEYTRRIHWQFAFDHGRRDSNLVGRNYRYNAAIAQVRYVF